MKTGNMDQAEALEWAAWRLRALAVQEPEESVVLLSAARVLTRLAREERGT